MDNIVIPASMTLENCKLNRKYKWKSDLNKISTYNVQSKRAIIRFTCKNFAYRLSKLDKQKRRVSLVFTGKNSLLIKRDKNGSVSLQGHTGKHPVIQVCGNRALTEDLKKEFTNKTRTIPLEIVFNLNEWKDLNISPEDFIIEVEKHSKSLMRKAIDSGFNIERVSRGRMYDLQLITPNKKEIIIAISSHVAKNENRSKEKRIQKILMDISKMMVYVYGKKEVIPVIITESIESEKSWSYTTKKYLDFYRDKFRFRYLTTDFKKGWEDNVIKELLKI